MRATLRRSCNACAKAKHSCDLRTPRCTRCIKRAATCVYANEPLTSSSGTGATSTSPEPPGKKEPVIGNDGEVFSTSVKNGRITPRFADSSIGLLKPADASFDPFDSYPPTRLPRIHVQRLIQHFLSTIAFQYYPLDLRMESNPFVISWWPLALADPALFHVSIQTASLDEELRAQQGFPISDLLMADSVSLVRQRIGNSSLAFQDETLNSVVALAAIEHGKGNVEASRMHIDGILKMVGVRGGISEVKCTSPLTARMVSWVSMLVMGAPQFQIRDDIGFGSGIEPIPQWHLASMVPGFEDWSFNDANIEPAINDVLTRLRVIFYQPDLSRLTGAELHDLTCFIMHKVLLLPLLSPTDSEQQPVSECLRYAILLYMLIIHGMTYYSHVELASTLMLRLQGHLEALTHTKYIYGSLGIWIFSICIVSATGTPDHQWFFNQACLAAKALDLHTWDDVLVHLKRVFWTPIQGELFQRQWDEIFKSAAK